MSEPRVSEPRVSEPIQATRFSWGMEILVVDQVVGPGAGHRSDEEEVMAGRGLFRIGYNALNLSAIE